MDKPEEYGGSGPEIERRGKDRFGRRLAYTCVSDADVGEMLIRAHVAVRWGNGRPDCCSQSTR
jgi:endonuclease YncB( thermonuclease family)